jgi:hypothetical protein
MRTIQLRIVLLKGDARFFLCKDIDYSNFIYLLTFGNQIIIINMRLGRVAKRLIEGPKTALHPVAFFLSKGEDRECISAILMNPVPRIFLAILHISFWQELPYQPTVGNVVKEHPDSEYQLIWLYRLCLFQAPEFCEEIVKSSSEVSPLLNIAHKYKEFQSKKNYCDIFSDLKDISQNDKNELKKFKFININKLKIAKKEKISPRSISPFKYEGTLIL